MSTMKRRQAWLVVGVVAMVGVVYLVRSLAAAAPVAFEAESGILASGAAVASVAGQSGTGTVRFAPAATPSPTGTPAAAGRYQVNDRFLYDPCGQKVVVRGVEDYTISPFSANSTMAAEVGKTGANTFRILLWQYAAGNPTAAQFESLINTIIANKMTPEIGVGANTPQDYLDPTVQAVLLKYQNKILIHAMGEGQQANETQWASESKAGIATLRAAGYTAPLYILANNYGRNLPTLLHKAPEVLASDPLHNIIFGWQAYWGEPGNYYQNMYGMTMHEAMLAVSNAPVMIQAGLSYETDPSIDPSQIMNFKLAMQDAQSYDISWQWWDWRFGGSAVSLTTNGLYGSWRSPFGAEVAVNNVGALNKSVRTPYQLTGTCQP